jgi:RNA polymerase sigma factor (sigma-70 family)
MQRIAILQALTYKRAAQRYCRIEEDHVSRHNITPEVEYANKQRDTALKNAIDGLSHHERRIINMHHLEELSTNEIACLMGVTPLRVRVWLFRARQKLRKKLTTDSVFS